MENQTVNPHLLSAAPHSTGLHDALQVALMESIAVAKTLADRNNYSINPNRELLGSAAELFLVVQASVCASYLCSCFSTLNVACLTLARSPWA